MDIFIIKAVILLSLLAAAYASAADITCHGPVVMAMGDHPGCIDTNGVRQMAFKTNSTSNPWMCAKSELASSMILSAVIANKAVSVWIDESDEGHTCSNLPNYSDISYIIFYK